MVSGTVEDGTVKESSVEPTEAEDDVSVGHADISLEMVAKTPEF